MASLTVIAALIKSSSVSTTFALLRNYVDPTYSNPQCALRVVNETNPIAYAKHPYWKDLVYSDFCAGENLERWIEHQTIGNQIGERMITDWVLFVFTKVLAPVLILYGLYQMFFQSKNFSIAKMGLSAVASFLVSFVGATVLLMHTHFDVDIIYMAGGIFHHAVADAPAINYKSNTITEGYVLCGTGNRIFYSMLWFILLSQSPRIVEVVNPSLMIGLMQVIMLTMIHQVGIMHPIYHDMASNGSTPAMDRALPYTHEWRAFKHCITHHDQGYSFSGDLFLDPLWDIFLVVMSFLHNQVFRIPFGSPSHFAFSTVADAAMGVMGVSIVYGLSYLLSLLVGSSVTTEKKKVQ